MGKNILTPTQHFVLDLASREETITSWFYFTGGTALSQFYLYHRYSEDLDFFSETEFNPLITDVFIKKISQALRAKIEKKSILGHAIYTLNFSDKSYLKIDFVYQPFKQLERGKKYHKLKIAILWDIIVDKLYTIFHRVRARDFVDLYFGIREVDGSFKQLIKAMKEKYEVEFDAISLLSRLPIVKDLKDYPKMTAPFDPKEMEEFFLSQVKSLEGMIFK